MSAMLGGIAKTKLVAAARAARKFIAQNRRTIVDSHKDRPSGEVTAPAALEWIREHDEVLAKLDAAIAKAQGAAS